MQDARCRVQGAGCRVQGAGLRGCLEAKGRIKARVGARGGAARDGVAARTGHRKSFIYRGTSPIKKRFLP